MLAGGKSPVSFFAYENQSSSLVPDSCEVIHLANRHEDVETALVELADLLGAKDFVAMNGSRPDLPSGTLGARSIGQALAALAPNDCIVSVDSGGGGASYDVLRNCVPHTWLNLTGGSIGDGGPVAVGAAIAEPERMTFALLGDGGAMYTNQYLWTAAREKLNVKTVIFSNRQYNILEVEYLRMGVNQIGERAASLFDLGNPSIDWVGLAKSQGVPASRATTCEEFNLALREAINVEGPYLIEAAV